METKIIVALALLILFCLPWIKGKKHYLWVPVVLFYPFIILGTNELTPLLNNFIVTGTIPERILYWAGVASIPVPLFIPFIVNRFMKFN